MIDDNSQLDPATKLNKRRRIPWEIMLGTGIFSMLLGILAILLPVGATFTIEIILASVLITAGIANLFHAIKWSHFKAPALRYLGGILYLLAGLVLAFYPLKGALTLTIFLAFLFMFGGTFKIIQATLIKPHPSWVWLLYNGIITVLLGFVIWLGLPDAGRWIIGLLVGIELFISGLATTVFVVSLKEV